MTDFPPHLPPHSPSFSPTLSPETIAQARAMYEDATPNAEIREFLGMTEKQFLGFRKAQGWPLRERFATPPRRPAWAEDDWEPAPETLTPKELMARLETAVAREFVRAERAQESRRPKHAAASLRMMGAFMKMLSELNRMRRDARKNGEEDPDAQNPARELSELREELARRLERIRESRRSQGQGVTLSPPDPSLREES